MAVVCRKWSWRNQLLFAVCCTGEVSVLAVKGSSSAETWGNRGLKREHFRLTTPLHSQPLISAWLRHTPPHAHTQLSATSLLLLILRWCRNILQSTHYATQHQQPGIHHQQRVFSRFISNQQTRVILSIRPVVCAVFSILHVLQISLFLLCCAAITLAH